MTAVGTSVATNAASILSTLGDGSATRSSGAGSSADGGFEALFSRTIEADAPSAVASDRAEMAAAPLDRRAGSDRQRDAVADDRHLTRADDPADRVTDPSDRAARADAADEPDDIDRPARPRASSDSNDPSVVAVPLVIVAPLAVQTRTAAASVTPSLVPGTVAATPTVEAAGAQPGATTETVASIVPGVPGATMATAGTPTDPAVATGVPVAAAASPTTIESLAPAVAEQGATSLAAAAQPMSSDATIGLQSSAAPAVASVDASLADAVSSSAGPSSPSPSPVAPVADSAMSAMSAMSDVVTQPSVLAPAATAQTTPQATAQAVGAADAVLDGALDAGGVESARSAASPATTAVDGPSTTATTTGTGSGTGTAAPGTGSASGPGAPTEPRTTTTATPERVTELRRMRDRAALGGVAGGAMSVDLSDEGLGPLTLHALQSASGVHLTLEAADQATRDLLTSQGRALRDELEAGGTALGSLDIQHSGPGSSGERGAGTPSGRIDRSGVTRSLVDASATTPLATVRPRPIPSTDGVDLLI
jgi:hypothetical protein